ncbi:uncharacterized protein LOC143123959 [Alosa pseudoharengus]|uniref:uncharacterized protein LOC143123959 n=1 Tax=Alosa pseudoharengus TaxID=34774 RepID=UPI003F8BD289
MTDISNLRFVWSIHCWVILPIALPVVCVAIYGLFSQIKTDHVAPVYVINLLISDVVLICTKPIVFSIQPSGLTFELLHFVHSVGMLASIVFMVCIAGERYVMIAHPLWYRFQNTITKSLLCSLTVWMATVVAEGGFVVALFMSILILYLFPYPFVIFFFVGTGRALSKSISVSPREQRRIMGTLALVLFIYTVLFLPTIVVHLVLSNCPWLFKDATLQPLAIMSDCLLSLNPVVDPILYVFMTKKKLPGSSWDRGGSSQNLFHISSHLYFELKLKNQASVFYFHLFSEVLMSLNPMLDPILYVFMRRDAKDILWAFPCFRQFQKCRKPLETQPTSDTADTLV